MQNYRSDSHLMDFIANRNSHISKKVTMKKKKLTNEQKSKIIDWTIYIILTLLLIAALVGNIIVYFHIKHLENAL